MFSQQLEVDGERIHTKNINNMFSYRGVIGNTRTRGWG